MVMCIVTADFTLTFKNLMNRLLYNNLQEYLQSKEFINPFVIIYCLFLRTCRFFIMTIIKIQKEK